MKKLQLIRMSFLFLACAMSLAACYPMPTEDDYSTVPSLNNPDLTREKPSNNPMPSGSF
jgi:hypothetical protein